MSIASLLHERLAGEAGALVGTRVYPHRLPQPPTYRAITYQRISSSGQDGSSTLRETRFQLDCWSQTYEGVVELATAVKTAMEEWHDVSETPGVLWARVVNEIDDADPEATTPGQGIYRVMVDVMLTTEGD